VVKEKKEKVAGTADEDDKEVNPRPQNLTDYESRLTTMGRGSQLSHLGSHLVAVRGPGLPRDRYLVRCNANGASGYRLALTTS